MPDDDSLKERLSAAVKECNERQYTYDCALTAWQQAKRAVDEILQEMINVK